MISTNTRNKWDTRIQLVLERSHLLDEKETEFIDSIELRRSQQRDLTTRQVSWLYDIYNRVGG